MSRHQSGNLRQVDVALHELRLYEIIVGDVVTDNFVKIVVAVVVAATLVLLVITVSLALSTDLASRIT